MESCGLNKMESYVVEMLESEFNYLTENPENYIEQQLNQSRKFKKLAQKLFGLTVSANNLTNLKIKTLKKLLIDGFDEEQIWQQIEIQNKAALEHFSEIAPAIDAKDISFAIRRDLPSCKPVISQDKDSDDSSNNDENYAFDNDSDDSSAEFVKNLQDKQNDEDTNHGEQYVFDDDSDSSTEMIEALRRKQIINGENEDDSVDLDTLENCIESSKNHPVPKKSSISFKSQVDDQFFKLSQLEEFLKLDDLKEGKKGDDFNMDDDGGIDLFQDIPSDVNDNSSEDSDDENKANKKSSKDFMYEDFFDEPESGDESISDENDETIWNEDEKGDHLQDMSDEDASDVDSAREDEGSVNKKIISKDLPIETPKSAFEIEQEKIKMKIQECEKSMLEPMPWHLTGEVAASNRPIDSLIEHEADFESNAKQELLVDNALTEKVENIIKMAIMNKAFSDVERRIKPTEEIIAYKKDIALEQTKSKKSLAQVYEEDYLKKQTKEEEKEDPKHKEIKKLMDSLFPELNALFSHIPKPAIPEIKIVSNLPAITVEEVAPTCVSDVTLLAPEEVKKKTGLVKGTTERTDTDRKRERRKKKIHQRVKERKNKEKLEQQRANNPTARMSKLEKLETLKKLKQNKITKLASIDEGGKIKSSKDFFSRLQDTVDMKRKSMNQNPMKKKKT